jgi:hypothetical protein
MVVDANLVEVAALVGDYRARHHAGRADGRPVADRDRACLPRARLAVDRERASGQARQRASSRGDAEAPLQLLPLGVAARRRHARKHQSGRRDRSAAAAPAALGADDALRLARTCYDHLAGRAGVAIADALTRAAMSC